VRRRDWLRLVGVSAAGLAASCGDDRPPGPATSLAAVFEPDSDGLLVAVYDESQDELAVEVRDDDGEIVTVQLVALGAHGTGVAEISGLAPAATYEIAVLANGRMPLGPLRARTAPRDDDPRAVRIAVSADFDPHPMFESGLVGEMLAAQPDLLVSLGDFPYCDNGPPVVQDEAGYRMRHVQGRGSRALRELHAGVAIRAIYDDHEFRNDWNPDLVEREATRYVAATTVWDEFFPLRDRAGDVRYRKWRYGAHVECFLLDCRRYRSASSAPDDFLKTMLGQTQRQWLIDGVRASTAPFKLIFTSVPLDFGIGLDHWKGFTTERELLFDNLVGVSGVLFVSADQHYFAAYQHAHGVREFQVGPLARGIGPYGEDAPGVLFRAGRYNAGLIEVTATELRVIGLGDNGERFYAESFTPDQLRPS